MSTIWGMCLVLEITELNSNQVISLDIIMEIIYAIGYGILELQDIHLMFVMKTAQLIATFNVNGVDDSLTRQPLIQVLYGKESFSIDTHT